MRAIVRVFAMEEGDGHALGLVTPARAGLIVVTTPARRIVLADMERRLTLSLSRVLQVVTDKLSQCPAGTRRALLHQIRHALVLFLGDALRMTRCLDLASKGLEGAAEGDGLANLIQPNVVLGAKGRPMTVEIEAR